MKKMGLFPRKGVLMEGVVFDIQRFSVHDGPGIRTTVFLKGCPLRCGWCHNPEGLSGNTDVQFFPKECIGCRRCQGERTADAAKKCPAGALKLCGEKITAESLLEKVLQDRDFYSPDGGVTFSGGECLLQAAFVAEMLKQLKALGISTAVDTCGCVPWENIQKTLPFCDLYLYDIKCADPRLHEKHTGKGNALILRNLEKLSAAGARIWIRTPVIPGVNDTEEEMGAIAAIIARLPQAEKITLMPYHTLGKSKYETLGLTPPYETDQMISPARLEALKDVFRRKNIPAD